MDDVTLSLRPDEISTLKHTTREGFEQAERCAENKSLWRKHIDPEAVMDFDTANYHDNLIAALEMIGKE